MIRRKIQMSSYIELDEQLVWVDKEVQLFFYHQRWMSWIISILNPFAEHLLFYFFIISVIYPLPFVYVKDSYYCCVILGGRLCRIPMSKKGSTSSEEILWWCFWCYSWGQLDSYFFICPIFFKILTLWSGFFSSFLELYFLQLNLYSWYWFDLACHSISLFSKLLKSFYLPVIYAIFLSA